jgi:hypothetical protein
MSSDSKPKSSKGKNHTAHGHHKKHPTSARRDGEPSNSNSNSNSDSDFDTSAVSAILGPDLEAHLKLYDSVITRAWKQKGNLSYTYTNIQVQNIRKELDDIVH